MAAKRLRRQALAAMARRTALSEIELLEFLRQLKRGRRKIRLDAEKLIVLTESGLEIRDIELLLKVFDFEGDYAEVGEATGASDVRVTSTR
jgi:hypothetical protein